MRGRRAAANPVRALPEAVACAKRMRCACIFLVFHIFCGGANFLDAVLDLSGCGRRIPEGLRREAGEDGSRVFHGFLDWAASAKPERNAGPMIS